jgi:hypothetical protein
MTNGNIERKDSTINKIGVSTTAKSVSHTRRKRKISFFRNFKLQRSEMPIFMTGVVILLIAIPIFTFLVDVIKKTLETAN